MSTQDTQSSTQPTRPLKLAVITGSVREGRFGPVVTRWSAEQAAAHGGFEIDVIDLADFSLPVAGPTVAPAMHADVPRPDSMAELTRRLREADAYLVVTPDYNRSFPASLKAAIDWYYSEWDAKAVAFVGYSGSTGGVLAIEQLRQVFCELNTHTVREFVSFPRFYLMFDQDGALREPAGPEQSAKVMLDQLAWWGGILRDARAAR